MQDSFDLTTIGATDAVFEAFQPYAARGLLLGRVSVVHSDRYRLYTVQGEMAAEAIGALLYRTERSAWPAVGDWVALQPVGPDEAPKEAMIHAVLPRRTMFSRRAAGDREQEQVIAANIDLALIVCGLDQDFNVRRIERYLTLAHASGVEAAIVLNKSDVCVDLSARLDETARVAGGAPVVAITARVAQGIDDQRLDAVAAQRLAHHRADRGPCGAGHRAGAAAVAAGADDGSAGFFRGREVYAGESTPRRRTPIRAGGAGKRQPRPAYDHLSGAAALAARGRAYRHAGHARAAVMGGAG